MENMGHFVSILMTAYNREKYIAKAIESVLASISKLELINEDNYTIFLLESR